MTQVIFQTKFRNALFALIATVCATALGGCGLQTDCNAICKRYANCFDKEYDVGKCVSACVTNGQNDKDHARKADICNACITDRDCAEATFHCADDCTGIVP